MKRSARIFLYSHDTFGLGHLRRNRKIAEAILRTVESAEVVLATGSDLAARFPPIEGLKLVCLPPVAKRSDGTYRSLDPKLTTEEVLSRRSAILAREAAEWRPDIFIADKEPLGLLGELDQALGVLSRNRTFKVLGIRDVLDEPGKLKAEWDSRGVLTRLPGLYDEIWIYGPEWFHSPLDGLDLPRETIAACRNTGFLGAGEGRQVETVANGVDLPENYMLATAGGGEDGEDLMRQVLSAYEVSDPPSRPIALLPGPLISNTVRAELAHRSADTGKVHLLDFHADPSPLIARASAVVAMCGYNTFCEVMEADRPTLFVPRETPRLEQYIRARRAVEIGVASMMRSSEANDPRRLAAAIDSLKTAPKPSKAPRPLEFDGLPTIARRIGEISVQREPASVT